MIRGYSIDLLHHFHRCDKFNVMNFIVETINRMTCEHKRSCAYAPYIQLLINSKVGEDKFLLDCAHEPFRPELENTTVTMDPNTNPDAATSGAAQTTNVTDAPISPTQPPVMVPKTCTDQITYLCQVSQWIEVGLANLVKNQESLANVVETQVHSINNHIDELAVEVKELRMLFMSEENEPNSDDAADR